MIPLLILGLLKEKPGSYGYELLAIMNERHYKFVVNYTKGSFYYNIQQLEEKRMIQRIIEDREAELREKNKYILTDLGVEEFNRLMTKYGAKTDYINLSFYSAMLFEGAYDKEKMKELVLVQIKQTEKKIALLEDTLKNRADLMKNFRRMLENSLSHHKVNVDWFHGILKEIDTEITENRFLH
ncbi:transcriptional regulator, PadR-like family [Niallia circulans]|uniref:PadR family transcriptional regulator n=1 Tax=Shouchella clausii TaxID=79880 RepID=UPI000BA650C3|nr:helix-turn-helix transcriptional regulator [Shouchella clausii]MCM3549146.1 PadR family transcriptional regulator [Shouchella clausii]PAF14081.1 PadR family transcriptional regulator [Shouchella clausii]SPT79321.1 transcriptional regulator, PadR-like family [Niallia circulans]